MGGYVDREFYSLIATAGTVIAIASAMWFYFNREVIFLYLALMGGLITVFSMKDDPAKIVRKIFKQNKAIKKFWSTIGVVVAAYGITLPMQAHLGLIESVPLFYSFVIFGSGFMLVWLVNS
jgi:UDP-N-acetylmuramyl pentapeptide phosphotransferase/UDP-N-acetylglucosamine-1-phosphate transferase